MPTSCHTHKNPCPILTIGCTGDAAAASLTMDQTSCFCPATRFAGANLASILRCEEKVRPLVGKPDPRVEGCSARRTWRLNDRTTSEVGERLKFMPQQLSQRALRNSSRRRPRTRASGEHARWKLRAHNKTGPGPGIDQSLTCEGLRITARSDGCRLAYSVDLTTSAKQTCSLVARLYE